jgi:hypothetical protein
VLDTFWIVNEYYTEALMPMRPLVAGTISPEKLGDAAADRLRDIERQLLMMPRMGDRHLSFTFATAVEVI